MTGAMTPPSTRDSYLTVTNQDQPRTNHADIEDASSPTPPGKNHQRRARTAVPTRPTRRPHRRRHRRSILDSDDLGDLHVPNTGIGILPGKPRLGLLPLLRHVLCLSCSRMAHRVMGKGDCTVLGAKGSEAEIQEDWCRHGSPLWYGASDHKFCFWIHHKSLLF